jgi:hypothetical protein
MYDFLLFVHVLSAFLLAGTVVIYSAVALGAEVNQRIAWVGDRFWDVGGLGTLVFGVWLAIYVDGYEVWDGWVIAALVLWAAATGLGIRAREQLAGSGAERSTTFHWLSALVVVLLLADMIWKPGA